MSEETEAAEEAELKVGVSVIVRDDIDRPDPFYVNRTGTVIEYRPSEVYADIPWQVLFHDNGDVNGFDAEELRVTNPNGPRHVVREGER